MSKPIIEKKTEKCYYCKGKGCKRCQNGQYTKGYLIVDSKGNGFFGDTLK